MEPEPESANFTTEKRKSAIHWSAPLTVVVYVLVQRSYVRTLLGKDIKVAGRSYNTGPSPASETRIAVAICSRSSRSSVSPAAATQPST